MPKDKGFSVPIVISLVVIILLSVIFLIFQLKSKNILNSHGIINNQIQGKPIASHTTDSSNETKNNEVRKNILTGTQPGLTPTQNNLLSDNKFAAAEDFNLYNGKEYFKVDTKTVPNTPGYLIISAIYSNNKDKVAVTEVEKTVLEKLEGDTTLKYKISIITLNNNQSKTIYEDPAAYFFQFPLFWSNDDNYLVTGKDVLIPLGRGGDDAAHYWKLSVTNGKLSSLAPYGAVITSDKRYVIYPSNNSQFEKSCNGPWGMVGENDGLIIRQNIIDGSTKDLIKEKYKRFYDLQIFGDNLSYNWMSYVKPSDFSASEKSNNTDAQGNLCVPWDENTKGKSTVKIY